MRKFLFVAIVSVALLIVIFNSNKEEEIRVRIIPDSNESSDLEEKEKVKNVVMYYLEQIYSNDYDTYFNNINNTYTGLEDIIDKNITDVSVTFSSHTLYNKTYNNSAVENKDCYTLYVVIKSGKGSNWWSSIYPEFLYDGSIEVIEYKSLILELLKR